MDRIRLGDLVRILKSPVAPVAEGKVGRVINVIGTHPTEPVFQVETDDGIHGLFQDELKRIDSPERSRKAVLR
jgi:hypothetical protein